MSLKGIIAFLFLAVAWGSSYFWMKLALREITPDQIVALRVLISSFALMLLLISTRSKLPKNIRTWVHLAVMAAISVVIPFTLLTWGNSKIQSSLTGMLNGTVPIFTVVFAHFFLPDEKLTLKKALGVLLGFCGVFFLMSARRNSSNASSFDESALGAGAVLLASMSYGASAIFARKTLGNLPSLTTTTVVMSFSALFVWIWHGCYAFVTGVSFPMPHAPLTWISLLWLGVVGSSLAYILYFKLLRQWDASRVSYIMYLAPVVAVVLGVLLLGEPLDNRLFIGSGLVLLGIAVANAGSIRKRRRRA